MIDNKPEHKTNHKKCFVCEMEAPPDGAFTEMAHYAPETGNLMVVARLACVSCREEILSVRQYVKDQGLVFGKNSQAFEEHISQHLHREIEGGWGRDFDGKEDSLYHKYVELEVKRVISHLTVESVIPLQEPASELPTTGVLRKLLHQPRLAPRASQEHHQHRHAGDRHPPRQYNRHRCPSSLPHLLHARN